MDGESPRERETLRKTRLLGNRAIHRNFTGAAIGIGYERPHRRRAVGTRCKTAEKPERFRVAQAGGAAPPRGLPATQ